MLLISSLQKINVNMLPLRNLHDFFNEIFIVLNDSLIANDSWQSGVVMALDVPQSFEKLRVHE